MYAKCGELGKAKELLDMHKSSTNVVTWTALIAGYARDGHNQNALDCFEQTQREGILPDANYSTCIRATTMLSRGLP
jgi:pentatricopeptide repeat protein